MIFHWVGNTLFQGHAAAGTFARLAGAYIRVHRTDVDLVRVRRHWRLGNQQPHEHQNRQDSLHDSMLSQPFWGFKGVRYSAECYEGAPETRGHARDLSA